MLVFMGSLLLFTQNTYKPPSPNVGNAIELPLTPHSQNIWPMVQLLTPQKHNTNLTIEQLLNTPPSAFSAPTTEYAGLAYDTRPYWVHFPLINTSNHKHWVLNIDYATLNKVDFYLTHKGHVLSKSLQGTHRPYEERALLNYSHSTHYELKPNTLYDVYIKVQSDNALVIPIKILPAKLYVDHLATDQLAQGLLLGFSLFLLVYCFSRGYTESNTLYLKYIGFISGYLLLSLYHFGIGQKFLWTDNLWLDDKIDGIATFIITASSFFLLEHVLKDVAPNKLFSKTMRLGGYLHWGLLIAYIFGLFTEAHRTMALFAITSYVSPWFMSIPRSVTLIKQKQPMGVYTLIAIITHLLALILTTGLVIGVVKQTFMNLHALQIGMLIDAVLFLGITTHYLKIQEKQKKQIINEHKNLKKEVHTDYLTGLLNRRGIIEALNRKTKTPASLAIYFIDLDDFKKVNDQYTHDIGDDFLKHIGQKLKNKLRHNDVAGRFGGDEFVLVMSHVACKTDAEKTGRDLLNRFKEPYQKDGLSIPISMSIGYALYPDDAEDAHALLNLADQAMYKVKKKGKNSVCHLSAWLPPQLSNYIEER